MYDGIRVGARRHVQGHLPTPWKCCKVIFVLQILSKVSVDSILRKCRQLLWDPHRGSAPGPRWVTSVLQTPLVPTRGKNPPDAHGHVRNFFSIFTSQQGMQTRSSDENFVRPSVNRVNCGKTEKNQSRFLYHTKDHLV